MRKVFRSTSNILIRSMYGQVNIFMLNQHELFMVKMSNNEPLLKGFTFIFNVLNNFLYNPRKCKVRDMKQYATRSQTITITKNKKRFKHITTLRLLSYDCLCYHTSQLNGTRTIQNRNMNKLSIYTC